MALFVLLHTAGGAASISAAASRGNVLILDHYNYNHRQGDHNLLKAFFLTSSAFGPTQERQRTSRLARARCGPTWQRTSSI